MTLLPWFLTKKPLRLWSKHRTWDIAMACAVLVGALVIFVQAAHAQVVLPINDYNQQAYVTDDPVAAAPLMGLATNAGRYSIELLDGCDDIVSGINVLLYFTDAGDDFWIVPTNDDDRYTHLWPELPDCHIALGERMADVPCFTVYSELSSRELCDWRAEVDE